MACREGEKELVLQSNMGVLRTETFSLLKIRERQIRHAAGADRSGRRARCPAELAQFRRDFFADQAQTVRHHIERHAGIGDSHRRT